MSLQTKAKKLSTIAFNLNTVFCSTKYLFIFSHMRSRSSLLSHVLGSHDEICGYSEQQMSYENRIDLINFRLSLHEELKCDFKEKYLLDKIVNNKITFSEKIFKRTNPKIIFLLREPECTMKSIIKMGDITDISWYKDPEKVLEYYCSRLSQLGKIHRKFGHNSLFLESNELVNNTDVVLEKLSKWLNLDQPLSKQYSIFRHTGKAGYGDPSENIKMGKIEKTKGYPDIIIPQHMLHQARSCYLTYKASITL